MLYPKGVYFPTKEVCFPTTAIIPKPHGTTNDIRSLLSPSVLGGNLWLDAPNELISMNVITHVS